MNKSFTIKIATIVFLLFTTSSQATHYDFSVVFDGTNHQVTSSLDPKATFLAAGDTFTYNYSTFGNDYFEVIYPNPGYYPYLWLETTVSSIAPTVSMAVELKNDGISVAQAASQESSLGSYIANTQLPQLANGTMFDEIIFTITKMDFGAIGPILTLSEYQPTELDNIEVIPSVPPVGSWVQYTKASSPVPEPTTLLLFGTGLAGIAGLSRKVRK